jgi:hypothetical protein
LLQKMLEIEDPKARLFKARARLKIPSFRA